MTPPSAAHSSARTDRIQDGIYFRSGETPPPCWRLLLLNARPGATPGAARAGIERIVEVLQAMQWGGLGSDLAEVAATPAHKIPKGEPLFTFLLGYGARFFDEASHRPELTDNERPDFLSYLHRKSSAFSSIPWAQDGSDENPGEADFCIQLTGVTEGAVNRALVEVWNDLSGHDSPLSIAAMYSGFQRDDGRSWLGFHDGVSNIQSSQRLAALEAQADPPWIEGGTYMAFLRFGVDLVGWRRLTRAEQEIVVGRDKLTGCPLVDVRKKGNLLVPVPRPGCSDDDDQSYRDPPQQNAPLVEASHIHRANQTRAAPTTPASHRIFRQGYEFLDSFSQDGPSLGLNFVSFQNDLEHLVRVLDLPGWLGDVNFGGPARPQPGEPPQLDLLKLLVGGLYAIPPCAEPIPGAKLFR